jgi:hypothetical protein
MCGCASTVVERQGGGDPTMLPRRARRTDRRIGFIIVPCLFRSTEMSFSPWVFPSSADPIDNVDNDLPTTGLSRALHSFSSIVSSPSLLFVHEPCPLLWLVVPSSVSFTNNGRKQNAKRKKKESFFSALN